jgi:glutaminyl-peptide cyclotransferase
MMNKQRNLTFIGLILVIGLFLLVPVFMNRQNKIPLSFDGNRAMQHVLTQVGFGPRTPGSEAHQKTVDYIVDQLKKTGWEVEIQETERMGHPLQNVVARSGSSGPWIIFGAHYDTRFVADQDADITNRALPVPGANDGASGVAVLLELARDLPKKSNQEIWLVFFDAEDQGLIDGWDWILGSQAFAESLPDTPDAVVVIDMIGDSDLSIYREESSDVGLTDSIWHTAANLGYGDHFIDQEKYNILDDHRPFLDLGIPAIDIIDFDYPYWHTINDTTDKVSADSLAVVGNTLLTWLSEQSEFK